MQIFEILKNGIERQLKVVISSDILLKKLEEYLIDYVKNIKINGFRAGKVPKFYIKRMYGLSIVKDIIDHILKTYPKKILSKRKELPIITPKINIIEDIKNIHDIENEKKNFSFILSYDVLPKINIEDIKNIKIEKEIYSLEDKNNIINVKYNKIIDHNIKIRILNKIEKYFYFEVPKHLIDNEFNIMNKKNKLNKCNITYDLAEKRVRISLILSSICEIIGILVNYTEILQKINRKFYSLNEKEKEKFSNFIEKNPYILTKVSAEIFKEKVLDYLIKNVNYIEKKVSIDNIKKEPTKYE